jgi:hypothetical protein
VRRVSRTLGRELEGEVGDVVGLGRAQGGEQVGQIDRAAQGRPRGAVLEHAQEAHGVEVDQLNRGQDVQRVIAEVAEQAPQRLAVKVAPVIEGIDVEVQAEVEGQRRHRPAALAIAPAVIGVAQDPGQEHADQLVAQAHVGELLDHLGAGHRGDQPAIGVEERLGLARAAQAGQVAPGLEAEPGATRHGQERAEIVDHEQRQPDAEAGQGVGPGGGADRRHRTVDGDRGQGQGRDLARQRAAATVGRDRHQARPGRGDPGGGDAARGDADGDCAARWAAPRWTR